MKQLLILSGKGGTGKTTTAAAFMRFAQARAAADCDVDAPNLHLVAEYQCGQPEYADFFGGDKANIDPALCVNCGKCQSCCRFGAISERSGKREISEFACEGCGVCAHVCPKGAVSLSRDIAGRRTLYAGERVFSTAELKMGRGNSGKLVSEVKQAMLKGAPECELAIIDGSPGIGCPVISSVSGVDLVLVVAEPSMSGASDLERLIKTAEILQAPMAVCVNKYDVCPEKAHEIRGFCRERNVPFVGFLPYDGEASRAINRGQSVADVDCPLRDALYSVYQTVLELLEQPIAVG